MREDGTIGRPHYLAFVTIHHILFRLGHYAGHPHHDLELGIAVRTAATCCFSSVCRGIVDVWCPRHHHHHHHVCPASTSFSRYLLITSTCHHLPGRLLLSRPSSQLEFTCGLAPPEVMKHTFCRSCETMSVVKVLRSFLLGRSSSSFPVRSYSPAHYSRTRIDRWVVVYINMEIVSQTLNPESLILRVIRRWLSRSLSASAIRLFK